MIEGDTTCMAQNEAIVYFIDIDVSDAYQLIAIQTLH